MSRLFRAVLFFFATTLVAGPGRSQEHPNEDPAPRAAASSKPAVGEEVHVIGKYRELVDTELLLFDSDLPFRLKKQELLKKILAFKPSRDNLSVRGKAFSSGGGIAIEVEELEAAPSDLESFTARAERLIQSSEKGRGEELFSLAKLILLHHQKYDDTDLLPLARRVAVASLRAREETLGPADVEGRVALVREMYQLFKNKESAVEALREFHKRFPEHPRIQEFLMELDCRMYRGEWHTYQDFKRLEGFVEHQGRWVKPWEKDLLVAMEDFGRRNQINVIWRKRTEREYVLLAQKGEVEEGMRPEEVYLALGFPDRVERRLHGQKEFSQWAYADKYYYFYDGVLVRKPEQ